MTRATRQVTDAERRARLVHRHHLLRTAATVVDAVRGVAAFHSSDPVTPYLSAWARTANFSRQDLDQALFQDRTLWRLHAMRRTLFVVPTDDAPAYLSGAAEDVARRERKRLEGWLAVEMDPSSVMRFVADAEAAVLQILRGGGELRTQELTREIPQLGTEITLGSGRGTVRSPVSSRLLFLMAMDGRVVRTRPAGTWRSSQYRWATTAEWFGPLPGLPPCDDARTTILRRYLSGHGPATIEDIRWWTGWTAASVRAALDRLDPEPVLLEGGTPAVMLVDGPPPQTAEPEQVSLLPALDSTPMGWKTREWFLGPHGPRVFDRNGNVGPTVWAGGRIVGGWGQRPDGSVGVRLLESVGSETGARIAREAEHLEEWLGGVTVVPRFRTPLEREISESHRT